MKNRKNSDKDGSLVSVVVPSYNRERLLVNAIDSVFRQTHRPIELLIIDDGSTDNTQETIARWEADIGRTKGFTVRCVVQDNAGAPAARNLGMRNARGEFIQFLDSDDLLMPDKLSVQLTAMAENGTDMAVCDYYRTDKNGDTFGEFLNDGDLLQKLTRDGSVSVFAPLIRLDRIRNVWWNEKIPRNQDMDFMFKVFLLIDNYSYTPGMYCQYSTHAGAQISDSYAVSNPIYLRRMTSLVTFYSSNRKRVHERARSMMASTIYFMLKHALTHKPAQLTKRQLPSFYKRLRKWRHSRR